MMINLTAQWLADADFCAALKAAGPLGVGLLAELEKAHATLAEVESHRTDKRGQLRELIDRIAELDIRHDRKARGLHLAVRSLIELADDDASVVEHRSLLDLLFPAGLSVTNLSHSEQGGSAVALERAVKPEIRAKLAAIQVGSQTLEQVFDAWMASAHELARVAKQRAELVARTSRDGSGGQLFDLKAGRNQWIRAVRGLLWALDIKSELADVREGVVAVVARASATAQRRSASGGELIDGDIDDVVLPEDVDVTFDVPEADAENPAPAGTELDSDSELTD